MGGGIIRTAGKAVASGAFRSPLIDEAARQQLHGFSSVLPVVGPEPCVPILSAESEGIDSPAALPAAHWPQWELTGNNEEIFGSVGVASRLVFGPTPTLEEAKQATADLKNSLEKVCFGPQHALNSLEKCHGDASVDSGAISAVPKHVTQMFSLLQGSHEAQVVVASLASDKNVWDAVMKNEKLIEFCRNSQLGLAPQRIVNPAEECVADNKLADGFAAAAEVEDTTEEGSGFKSFVNNIKVKVFNMLTNISNLVQDIFNFASSGLKEAKSSNADTGDGLPLKASFMALAVATILVVLLKRGCLVKRY
ncbi:hypothetical protein HPP92_005894 [Vanilla planifolia]|uniref:Uncharacterized protein n=1 Tax=Vanilla planifolia TaxID=51239 RepID=A0A835RPI1_VANPL|nr:hypothetical protein HPP92_005894 [Vanilla planifolia]